MDYVTLFLLISFIWVLNHLFLLARKRSSNGGRLPPGPLSLPIVGNLFRLDHRPNESLADLAKIYGPLMTLKLGSKTAVVVSSSAVAQQVLQKKDQIFAGRSVRNSTRALQHHEASPVWLQPDLRWRRLRTLCNTQPFTTQRLDSKLEVRRQKVQELLAHLREKYERQEAVDVGQVAFSTILNLVSNTIFSVDLVDFKSEIGQEFKEVVWRIMEDAGKPNMADYFPWLKWVDPHGARRRMTANFRKMHAVFDRMIDQRLLSRSLNDSSRRNDFLDAILDQNQETGIELKRHEIKALLVDIFVAGSDTSSATIEWAMAELLRNPNAMATARSELQEAIGKDKEVEESDIAKLPYLKAVVKETFRLHPPAPLLIPHMALSSAELCGFTIPEKTQVIVNAWSIGRDGDIWPDLTSFLPERFLGSKLDFKGQDFELIPFGAGRRICPGLPLAFRMVHLMLASLLHSFSWNLPDGIAPHELNMNSKFGIGSQMEVPLRALPLQD